MTDDVWVGLFGLGNMGAAIASRLTTREGTVLAHDPDPARVQAAEQLASTGPGPGSLKTVDRPDQVRAPIVVLSLPSPSISHSVVATLATTLEAGAVVVETSTVNPADARAMAATLEPAGIGFVDAAVLSGVAPMRRGESALLIGGDDDHLTTVAPVLDALTPRQTHLGPVGAGMAAKVINNAVAHAVMVVLAEAGAMARTNGVSGHDLAEMLSAPDAGLIRPLTHRYAERILGADYEGGMPTEAARKDSTLALALAQDSGVPLFTIQAAHTVYEMACDGERDRLDYAAIATLWEDWIGHPLTEGR